MLIRSPTRALLAAVLLSLLCSCVARHGMCQSGGAPWQRSELFFGLARPARAQPVDDATFARFVSDVVTPRLPAGFTLVTTEGAYTGRDGVTVREPGRLLIALHHGDRATHEALEQVRTLYRAAFAQESVLRTDASVCASF